MSDEYVVTLMLEGLGTTGGAAVIGWLSQKLIGVSFSGDPSKGFDNFLKMALALTLSMAYTQRAIENADKDLRRSRGDKPSPL